VNGAAPRLRIARPSRDLQAATRFYTQGLGFDVLGSFEDHDGARGATFQDPDGYGVVLCNEAFTH
jgi:hypothetical protein